MTRINSWAAEPALRHLHPRRSLRGQDQRSLLPGHGDSIDEAEAALEADGPTLVDIVAQLLREARAPVSEWIA